MTRVRPVVVAIVVLSALVLGGCAEKGARERAEADTPSSSPEVADPLGDDTWIAYQTDRSGEEGVWLVHPDGTDDHQVMTGLPNALLPDWSPDGTRLAVTTRGGDTEPLMEYDLESDSATELFDCASPCLGDDEPAYSPDGTEIAFSRYLGPIVDDVPSDCSLWVGDLAAGTSRRVSDNGTGCDREYNPRWSPDGERLVYWRQPSADGRTDATAVFTVSADGTSEQRLTDPAMEAGEPDWSPDGDWIVVATRPLAQFDDGVSDLFRIHPDGTGLEQLTDGGVDVRSTQPRYSPDGEWIVFTRVTTSGRTLSALPASGGEPVAITSSGIFTHGTWQP